MAPRDRSCVLPAPRRRMRRRRRARARGRGERSGESRPRTKAPWPAPEPDGADVRSRARAREGRVPPVPRARAPRRLRERQAGRSSRPGSESTSTNPAVTASRGGRRRHRAASSECEEPCISPLHTHATAGILHTETETPTPNKLGQFFTEWDVRSTETASASYCSPATPIAIYVNGKAYTGDPREIELGDRGRSRSSSARRRRQHSVGVPEVTAIMNDRARGGDHRSSPPP